MRAWPAFSVDRIDSAHAPLILGRRFTSPACNRLDGPLAIKRGWGGSSFTCVTKPSSARRVAVPHLTRVTAAIGQENSGSSGTLLIWRSRYWFNYGDLLSFIVHIATSLVSLPQPLTIVVPPILNGSSSTELPEFYRALLSAFGEVYLRDEWTEGRIYSNVCLCCLNNGVVDAEGRHALVSRTLTRTLTPGASSAALLPRPLLLDSHTPQVLRMIRRRGLRVIRTHAEVLRACNQQQHRGVPLYRCEGIDFMSLTLRSAGN